MKKSGYSLSNVIIIIIVTALVSSITIGTILINNVQKNNDSYYSKLLEDENAKELLNIYSELVDGYYENINKDQLVQNAVNGMTSYLDETYTTYLDKDSANSLHNQLDASYTGIGIVIQENTIMDVISNSPAESAGIKIGDVIESINGTKIEDMDNSTISDLIKSNSEEVIINVNRNNQLITFKVLIKSISVPSVGYTKINNTSIGYLQISIFGNNTSKEMATVLKKIKEDNIEKLIIDLRNNTGGYLDETYSIAQMFLEKGKIVYQLSNTNDKLEKYKDKTSEKTTYPIVILINDKTASASEILASALKEGYGATLIGKRSYGKGKVQHTYNMDNGSIVKYTASKWYTANGICIDGIGLTPDYEIENEIVYKPVEGEENLVATLVDRQLNKAIELLNK